MLVLASDPDREGEAIAWHVLEMLTMEGALKKGMKVKRVVFNEITKAAVLRAMEAPREISGTLVNAYLARRALDYLIGFDLSPVLWRKLPGSKSAGRVQSAALRLVCERELAIEAFHPREYWTVEAQLTKDANNSVSRGGFRARLTHYLGEKLGQFALGNSIEAEAASKSVGEAKLRVGSVKKSLLRRTPPAPYITSTLQQDASTKLAFGASRTMAIAQQLYEGVKLDNEEQTGLITYMRTDGVQISNEAVESIRQLAAARYGEEYVPSQKRQFTSRVKNAQEAHEAIRPTDINCLPSSLAAVLEEDALKLYTLIWARTMACQLEQAILSQVAIDIVDDTDNVQLRSNGSSVSFPGYLAVLEDMAALGVKLGDPQEQEKEEEEGGALENFEVGDLVTLSESCAIQHFTEPPPRFSEGTIVKRLEELGIGRPSTYASTLRTLQLRNYVRLEKRRIFPETRGRMVSAFLSHYFPQFSDYDFTANMENQLDEVSAGNANWKALLAKFWPEFHENVLAAMKIPIDKVVEMLEEIFAKQFFPPASSGGEDRVCPSCKEGRVCMKLSRFGSGYFFGCTRYPTCLFKANVMSSGDNDSSDDDEDSEAPKQWSLIARPPKVLGVDPATQLQVVVRVGPYGGYVQLGEASKKQKPRRTTLPKGVKAEDISLEKALELLSYPRELGKHPEEGTPITIGIGKFGFYVRHRAIIASVPQEIFVQELTLEKALKLLKGRNVSKRGRPPYKAVAEVDTTDKVTSLPDSESVSHTEEQNQSTEQLAGNKNKKGKEKKKQLHKSQNGAAVTSPSNGPPVIADPSASSQLAEDNGGTTSRRHLDLPKKGRGRPRKSQEASNNSEFLAANAMTQQPLP
ncbi:hypothetical protein BDL97_14G067700 [Sphagnum fallax]|nr:hypothetical protein BDL97_14G067700 [Sphagnum fallax]